MTLMLSTPVRGLAFPLECRNHNPAVRKAFLEFQRPTHWIARAPQSKIDALHEHQRQKRERASLRKAAKQASKAKARTVRMDDLLALLPAPAAERIRASIDRPEINRIVVSFDDVLWADEEGAFLHKLFAESQMLEALEPALLASGFNAFGERLDAGAGEHPDADASEHDTRPTPLQDVRRELREFLKTLRDRRKPSVAEDYAAARAASVRGGPAEPSSGW